MTDVTNFHTGSVGGMNLFTTMVAVVHGEFLEFASDVISGS